MLKSIEEAVQPMTQLSTSSANNTMEANAIRAKVDQAIKESADLVTALEAVGAMYGIPASSIISEDDATTVRVVDDTIIAPPVPNPSGQTKVIMQAIGSVLDYISQRIDDKVNDFQLNNISNGIQADKMDYLSGGHKGKCVGIYNDDDGGEIHAYDTGIVDMPNTPAAKAKVDELRASNTIPTFDPSIQAKRPGDDYFNDEDDITEGVAMEAKSDKAVGEEEINEFSIAKEIQESAYHINMIAKLGDTTHLGYDLLRRHGFDYVKPIDSVIQEAASEKKKKKNVTKEDIKYMKFDNSNIIKAVKLFNEARAEQDSDAEKLDLKKFVNESSFKEAVECLNKQFDCVFNIRFFSDGSSYENVATNVMSDIKRNLTISKSKGFQLNGQPIAVYVYNRYFEHAVNDSKLFGQHMVSIFLHELFHNIAYIMREDNAKMSLSLLTMLNAAGSTEDIAEKRKIITNYVDTLDAVSKSKVLDKVAKKKMVKQLLVLSMVEDSEAAVKKLEKNTKNRSEQADQYIDKLIKFYKKQGKRVKGPGVKSYIGWTLVAAAGIITAVMAGPIGGKAYADAVLAAGVGVGVVGVSGLVATLTCSLSYLSMLKNYESSKLYEEYYCDLFAGMYKLPVMFFVGPSKEKYTVNEFSTEKLDKLAKLEAELYKSAYAKYPTPLERTHASVRIAKTLLEQKDLEPEIRKYCQWIVDNFSDIHKTSIGTIYNQSTFDPEEAEHLDKHLSDLISKNNITLTESFIQYFNSDEDIISAY